MIVEAEEAYKILLNGDLLIYPSDTVYGLGCIVSSKKGIATLQSLKPRKSGFIILVDEWEKYSHWIDLSLDIQSLQRPAPTTWVFPATKYVPTRLLNTSGEIAIRQITNHPISSIIAKVGQPLISTSANKPGRPTPTNPTDIAKELAYPILAGFNGTNLPSSIIHYQTQQVLR